MSYRPIRVVLADDHAVVRAGLRAVLGTARDIQVVAEAKDGGEAIDLAERLAPDVVVMDLTMAPMSGDVYVTPPAARVLAQALRSRARPRPERELAGAVDTAPATTSASAHRTAHDFPRARRPSCIPTCRDIPSARSPSSSPTPCSSSRGGTPSTCSSSWRGSR